MDSHSTGLIIALIVLIVLSAYFSATETAFSSLNRIRLKNLADNGNKRAKLAYKLVDNYDELISSVLVGNNIVNISASSLATVLFIKAFGDNGPTVSTIAMTFRSCEYNRQSRTYKTPPYAFIVGSGKNISA